MEFLEARITSARDTANLIRSGQSSSISVPATVKALKQLQTGAGAEAELTALQSTALDHAFKGEL